MARKDGRSTQREVHSESRSHKKGQHGAKSRYQPIEIGLSKARRKGKKESARRSRGQRSQRT